MGRLEIGTANTSQFLSECTQSQSEFACHISFVGCYRPIATTLPSQNIAARLDLCACSQHLCQNLAPPPCPPRIALRVVRPNRLLEGPSLTDLYRGPAAPCPSGSSSFIASLGPVTVCKSDTMTAPGESDSLEIQSVPGDGFGAALHLSAPVCSCCACHCHYAGPVLRLSDYRTAADQIVSGSALVFWRFLARLTSPRATERLWQVS